MNGWLALALVGPRTVGVFFFSFEFRSDVSELVNPIFVIVLELDMSSDVSKA